MVDINCCGINWNQSSPPFSYRLVLMLSIGRKLGLSFPTRFLSIIYFSPGFYRTEGDSRSILKSAKCIVLLPFNHLTKLDGVNIVSGI